MNNTECLKDSVLSGIIPNNNLKQYWEQCINCNSLDCKSNNTNIYWLQMQKPQNNNISKEIIDISEIQADTKSTLVDILEVDNKKIRINNFWNYFDLKKELENKKYHHMVIIKIKNINHIKALIGIERYLKILKEMKYYIKQILINEEGWEIYKISENEIIFLKAYNKEWEYSMLGLDFIEILKKNIDEINVVYDNQFKFHLETSIWSTFYSEKDTLKKTYTALQYAEEVWYPIIYTPWLGERIDKENKDLLTWVNKIKLWLKNKDKYFTTHLQWIINNETWNIEKYEALTRYKINRTDENNDNKTEYISPYFYLKYIEKLWVTVDLMNINIKSIIEYINQNNIKNKEFSINCYASDIMDIDNFETLLQLTEEYDIDRKFFIIEVLEYWNIESDSSNQTFIKNIKILKNYWFKIAIDDFWTWQSNFVRLLQIKPNYIKIDWNFIKWIASNNDNQNIVKAVMELSKISNSKVIAEFVANEDDYQMIKSLWVHYSQWYLFHKPTYIKEVI